MPNFRFHVVGLPHTVTSKEYLSCAYTQKVLNFCKMMKSLGHTVYHYGGEGSQVDCDEHVTTVTAEDRQRFWGDNDWHTDFYAIEWNPELPCWVYANANAVGEIKKRIQEKDFICLIGGVCQKPIADAFPAHMSVEYGIGYTGTFSKFRVFESYAFMHYLYGLNGEQNGSYYDAVIPNYYDPSDFHFSAEKDDYYLYVGRMIARKGPHIAVEATKALGTKLIMAGQGVIGREGQKLISREVVIDEPHVEHVGSVGLLKRGELMSRAKALIIPTQYIGPFEGVAVEAMLCGTPVVATDWGCHTENIIDGFNGFRARTFGEMVEALKRCQHLDPLAIAEWAERKFSLDSVKYRYQNYFEQLYDLWGDGWYSMRVSEHRWQP